MSPSSGHTSAGPAMTSRPPLSRIALASAVLSGAALLSLLGILAFGLVVSPAQARGILPRVAAGLLYAGLVLGAITGHVLGLIAFTRRSLREGQERGRMLAFASSVLGVVLLLGCTIINLLAVPAFRTLTGAG